MEVLQKAHALFLWDIARERLRLNAVGLQCVFEFLGYALRVDEDHGAMRIHLAQ